MFFFKSEWVNGYRVLVWKNHEVLEVDGGDVNVPNYTCH